MSKASAKIVQFDVASQDLYGYQVLREAARQGGVIAQRFTDSGVLPDGVRVVFGDVLVSEEASLRAHARAAQTTDCLAHMVWGKTFSPAEMHIPAFQTARKGGKPYVLLQTQYSPAIPWATLDQDHMNANQTAHGGLEYAHGLCLSGLPFTPLTGDWQSEALQQALAGIVQAAAGGSYKPPRLDDVAKFPKVDPSKFAYVSAAVEEARSIRCAMFGGKMRWVAVTSGNPTQARVDHGWEMLHIPVGDLAARVASLRKSVKARRRVGQILHRWQQCYDFTEVSADSGLKWESVVYQAWLYLAMQQIMREHGCTCFTTCFHDTHGLEALPALASQQLQAEGYGFGPEGDWKQACLGRLVHLVLKHKGAITSWSLMEPYIYDFTLGVTLGSHMAEVSPALGGRPDLMVDVHRLTIGDSGWPARVIFRADLGPVLDLCMVQIGAQWRIIAIEQEIVNAPDTPKLPTACSVTKPRHGTHADMINACLLAGMCHHNIQARDLTVEEIAAMTALMPNTQCVQLAAK